MPRPGRRPPQAAPTACERGRGRVRIAGVAVGLAGVIVAAMIAFDVGGSARPAAAAVSVSIDARHPGPPVPRTFLGLSFEVSSLGQIARLGATGNFATMLRSLGPGVLRFGGVSADTRVAWTDAATPLAAWASAGLRAGELRDLRKLAVRSGWRVLLTIGLAHYDPSAAAREAAAARAALGGWLAGIELGNEPDAYGRHGLRSEPWTFSRYNAQVAAYRRAIARAAPGIPLAGPDVSGSQIFASWGRSTAVFQKPALLTGHHYPLGCHGVPSPSIAALLSPRVRDGEEVSLRRYLGVSRAGAIGFRLDEANSVSCGGSAGVSDTFASALWASDYIARAMAAGAVGINLQGAPANCRGYSPVCATPGRLGRGVLSAQPEWYALLLTRALSGGRPVAVRSRPAPANLDVFALLARGGLRVLIVNDDPLGAGPTAVSLHVPSTFAGATVLPLRAPSPAATSGVLLGGRGVSADGSWRAPRQLAHLANRHGVLTLTAPPASATLVTVAGAAGAQSPPTG